MNELTVRERDGAAVLRLRPRAAVHGAAVVISTPLRVMGADGPIGDLPAQAMEARGAAAGIRGQGLDFEASQVWRRVPGALALYDVEVTIRYAGEAPVERGVRFVAELAGAGEPWWLIPAVFYGENRIPACRRPYPRFDHRAAPDELVAATWSFKAERAALPAVLGWNDEVCGGLVVDEWTELGESGLGFSGADGALAVWVDLPYRQEPVRYDGHRPRPADVALHRWQPTESHRFRLRAYAAGPDRHAYAPLIRAVYEAERARSPLAPWMSAEQAAAHTAHGLAEWHYKPEHRVLYEGIAFDREMNANVKGLGDRAAMHVGWVSGAPHAQPLLAYGRRVGRDDYVEAGAAVLDTIAGGLAPCGLFWGEWRLDRGWSAGWNADPRLLHTRTLGEATLFMVRALSDERASGAAHPAWERAVRSNLDTIVRLQRDDGNLGTYHDALSGEVAEWDGAGGLIWIPALLEAARLLEDGTSVGARWRDAAARAGRYYARFVRDERIYGAPEDIHLAPSSEDGYNAVMAYVALADADRGDAEWLELATRSADWTMTMRWSYDIRFDPETMLGHYHFRTRGADVASPTIPILHCYGLICVPELVRLSELTGDDHWRQRARDNLLCFRQFIARRDGDFGAYRGMVTERYYHTDAYAAKGALLTLSHAWCVGLTLYANLWALEHPEVEVAPPPARGAAEPASRAGAADGADPLALEVG